MHYWCGWCREWYERWWEWTLRGTLIQCQLLHSFQDESMLRLSHQAIIRYSYSIIFRIRIRSNITFRDNTSVGRGQLTRCHLLRLSHPAIIPHTRRCHHPGDADMSPRHRSCTHGVKTLSGHYDDDDTHLTLETGDQVPGEDGQWSLMYNVCSLRLRLWCCVTGLCRTSAGPSVQSQPSCDSRVQCVSVSVATELRTRPQHGDIAIIITMNFVQINPKTCP